MLLHQKLIDHGRQTPEKPALIFGDETYTYADIVRYSMNLASWLVARGLNRGDRVALYLGNSPETAIAIYAVLQAGGCFSVINPSVKSGKLVHIFNNSQAKFVVLSRAQRQSFDRIRPEVETEPQLLEVDSDEDSDNWDFWQVASEGWTVDLPRLVDGDLAAIIYTSGSTGDPKGVTMSHRNMVSAATSITTYLENQEDDIILNMLPMSFDYGLYQWLMTVHMGATLVLERTFGYPYQILELIRKHRVTGLPCVPTGIAILLQLESFGEEQFESIRYLSNTAAPLSPAYLPRLHKAFPNARIFSMYGLTECKRVSYLPPDRLAEKPTSVGIPMPNTEVWIEDENGNKLPYGEVGELVVRGGSVMRGYWRDPEATAKRLKPGPYPWERVLYTGDLFRQDKEGYLYFVARKDDIIKVRGERVHPKEIEDILYLMEEVLHVRVVGVPHEVQGQAIKAEIQVKEGKSLDRKAVLAHCRQHLENLMIPTFIEIVEEMELTSSGKVSRS